MGQKLGQVPIKSHVQGMDGTDILALLINNRGGETALVENDAHRVTGGLVTLAVRSY